MADLSAGTLTDTERKSDDVRLQMFEQRLEQRRWIFCIGANILAGDCGWKRVDMSDNVIFSIHYNLPIATAKFSCAKWLYRSVCVIEAWPRMSRTS